MRFLPFLVTTGLVTLIASSASSVTMAWTPIGNSGNACDPQSQGCFGAVGYDYYIGTYEVTNAQYVDFLNAKAASDPLGLYNTGMGDPSSGFLGKRGGITRSGSDGSYTYSAIAGRENMPVNHVSFYDALRFTNWLNNGQGNGDTETGAYTLLGGTATPSNGTTVTRNAGAIVAIPTENEWYKAAYYNALSTGYFDYPAGSDTPATCTTPTATANSANCWNAVGNLTIAGSYTGSASPYGTFDQGGNVLEWNETTNGVVRGIRGGAFDNVPTSLVANSRNSTGANLEFINVGFRVTMIPEPSTGLLVIAGLLGLAGWRRTQA